MFLLRLSHSLLIYRMGAGRNFHPDTMTSTVDEALITSYLIKTQLSVQLKPSYLSN